MRLSPAKAALCAILSLALAAGAWMWWKSHVTRPWRPAIRHREIALRVMAEYLAAKFPAEKTVVAANPFALKSGQSGEIVAFEKAGITGIEEGFKKPGAVKVVYPELRPEFHQNPESVYVDPRTTTPLSYLVATNAFDQAARQIPDCRLIVSLIGLPLGVEQMEVWRDPQRPAFALLLPDWRILGDRDAVLRAFASGKIAAAILGLPGAPPEEESELKDYQAEFNRRFLLATRDNVEKLMAAHSKLF